MFAKRNIDSSKMNARKRKVEDSAEENDEDDVIDYDKLRAMKQNQELRVKKNGISTEELAYSSGDKKARSSSGEKTVEGMLDTQFSVTVDNGMGTTVPHQKIMEQYINEKLGLNKKTTVDKPKTIEDEIYKIPDEMRKITEDPAKIKADAQESDIPVVTTWSTGIAEVVLPSRFKEKSIIETDKLARKQQAEKFLSSSRDKGGDAGYLRFQLPDQSFKGYKSNVSSGAIMSNTEEFFLSGAAQAAEYLAEEQKTKLDSGQKSTDDKALQQFKRRLYERNLR